MIGIIRSDFQFEVKTASNQSGNKSNHLGKSKISGVIVFNNK